MVIELHHNKDFEQLLERSKTDPIFIFKHSTQCSISAAAYDEFMSFMNEAENVISGIVLVIEDRGVSNTIEKKLGVRHESPQAILVRNGLQRWNASHWAITADALDKAIKG